MDRVVSGVQPTGVLHLGNYYGALQQHLALQHQYPGECFYLIADYHALTTVQDPLHLREFSFNLALDYLALGLDVEKAVFYRQSDVKEVVELMWMLSCVTQKSLMERAHAYKDKEQKGVSTSMGLYTYPLLMTADILLVRGTIVPVGSDQDQHVEMSRDMVGRFHRAFNCEIFPEPKTKLNSASTVLGIDGQKMSKSYDNVIPLNITDEDLRLKINAIKTKPVPRGEGVADVEDDIIYNLFRLVAPGETSDEMADGLRTGQMGYGEAKRQLYDAVKQLLEPYREARQSLCSQGDYVEDVLQEGAKRARQEARDTMELVRQAVGLSRIERMVAI